jgi:hypothetical protein
VNCSYVDALQEKVKEYEAIVTKSCLVAGFKDGNGVVPEQQQMQVVDQHQCYQSEQTITVEESLISVCGEEDDEAIENEDDSPITDGMGPV